MNNKFILDACCGGRMFWFDKKHPNTLYIDIRKAEKGHIKIVPNHEINPDVIMDFRNLQFADKTFKLVIWDPPQLLTLGETSKMRKTYGVLHNDTWRYDLGKGFSECWRVLEDYGILIFKWNDTEISVDEILSVIKQKPLFGHPTGSKSKTRWFCFMKIPLAVNKKEDDEFPSTFSEQVSEHNYSMIKDRWWCEFCKGYFKEQHNHLTH